MGFNDALSARTQCNFSRENRRAQRKTHHSLKTGYIRSPHTVFVSCFVSPAAHHTGTPRRNTARAHPRTHSTS